MRGDPPPPPLSLNKVKRKAVRSGDANDWITYKAARNNVNNEIRQSKANYCHNENINNSGNGREIWKTINTLLSRKTQDNSINELKVTYESHTEPEQIAHQFNIHFTEIGTNLATALSQNTCDFEQFLTKTRTTFQFKLIPVNTVFETLISDATKKATGSDKISDNLLKSLRTLCVQFSVEIGVFPSELKNAKVIPLF